MSTTDPEARHGRKSKSHTFNGFKVHVLGDVVSGFIASLCVTPGNVHDGTPACRLILRAQELVGDIERVLADTAYGGARLRYMARGVAGVEIVAPPPADRPHPHGVGKQDFAIDPDTNAVTCPKGHAASEYGWTWSNQAGVHVPMVKWAADACKVCPLKAHCCEKTARKRLLLHPYERELRAARSSWTDPKVRRAYRLRTQCERIVNQVTRHGGREARTWGLGPAQLQAHVIGAASNLALLARRIGSSASP